MEPFEQEQGNQGCPNLDAQRILAGADKALDLEVLFEGLEEEFDLPAFAIGLGKGRGAEFEVVGQEHALALVLCVPYDDAAQRMGALGFGMGPGEADDLVGQDMAVVGHGAALDDLVDGVVLHAGDEEEALGNPGGELLVEVVGAVHDDARTRCQAQQVYALRVVAFGFRDKEGV